MGTEGKLEKNVALFESRVQDHGESFREQYLEDLESGSERSLCEYLRLFPEDELAVAREYIALTTERAQDHGLGAAPTDALTGLQTRHALETVLSERIRDLRNGDARRLGVMSVDLDGFKEVNDKQGHLAGDSVLRVVGKLLRSVTSPMAEAFRYGGDEFSVLAPDCSTRDLEQLGQRICRAISGTVIPTLHCHVSVSCSIGGVSIPAAANLSRDRVFAFADRVLYRAKNGGRNRVEIAEWRQ